MPVYECEHECVMVRFDIGTVFSCVPRACIQVCQVPIRGYECVMVRFDIGTVFSCVPRACIRVCHGAFARPPPLGHNR